MYAVFESGGLQFNAEEGALLKVPHLTEKPGETISIEKVLLVKDGEKVRKMIITKKGVEFESWEPLKLIEREHYI